MSELKIYKTFEYDKFKIMDTNRDILERHVKDNFARMYNKYLVKYYGDSAKGYMLISDSGHISIGNPNNPYA